jgi:hypothetical protein
MNKELQETGVLLSSCLLELRNVIQRHSCVVADLFDQAFFGHEQCIRLVKPRSIRSEPPGLALSIAGDWRWRRKFSITFHRIEPMMLSISIPRRPIHWR